MSIFPFISPEVLESGQASELPMFREYAYDFENNRLLLRDGNTYLVETGYRGDAILGPSGMAEASGRTAREVVRIEAVLESLVATGIDAAALPAEFTSAPVGAIKGLLAKVGWRVEEVDLFEVNEAFAMVSMLAMAGCQIPHQKLNVNGGACALGHPIGASGARILVTLLHALQARGKKKGLATLCIGGGEATAMAIELV